MISTYVTYSSDKYLIPFYIQQPAHVLKPLTVVNRPHSRHHHVSRIRFLFAELFQFAGFLHRIDGVAIESMAEEEMASSDIDR